ncbi:hypothetical protein GOP47_0020319 [Adiantum capillus-veneris]|uniref:Protein kinase domain-containing protein n=1 Tax=Adiantum capillus-veneris TaxID=13818 RepID=A0A9D4UE40_ADICA|nr:hypothetical protein GOP47_0020319 [Adiantum capillus-veneris]
MQLLVYDLIVVSIGFLRSSFDAHMGCPFRGPGCKALKAMVTLIILVRLSLPSSTGLTCPLSCSTISALPYPFGVTPGCGSPGFLLDCSFSPPQWNITTGGYTASYYIVSITSNPNYSNPHTGSYGYGGTVLLDTRPKTNYTCQLLEASSSATNNFISSDLYAFQDADLTYYQDSYLFFNCSVTDGMQPPTSGVLTNFSSSCIKYLEFCNFSSTGSCLEYIPDQKLQLSPFESVYGCEFRTRFVIPPGNDNVSTWIPYTQFAWGPVRDADSCSACQSTGGTCGYDTQDKRFLCYCGNKTNQTDCKSGNMKAIAVGVSVAAISLLVLVGIAFHYRHRYGVFANRKLRKLLKLDGVNENALEIPYSALSAATQSFRTKIGRGASGQVYRGLLCDGNEVAVKVLLSSMVHTDEQFLNELATIGNIHHMNIARLVGYCFNKTRRILVYEYVSNGSLDKYLFATGEEPGILVLNWKQRFKIALGIAQGLSYMHEDCRKCIIHCDIKPQNILLDGTYCPKIADFGLARLLKREESKVYTHARGTPGYVAPEFWSMGFGHLSAKFDVYSFGMVLLEIVRGRRALQEFNPYSNEEAELNSFVSVWIDERMQHDVDVEQARTCTQVALWCIQEDASIRPTMSSVVQYLQGTATVPDDPPMPFRAVNQK